MSQLSIHLEETREQKSSSAKAFGCSREDETNRGDDDVHCICSPRSF